MLLYFDSASLIKEEKSEKSCWSIHRIYQKLRSRVDKKILIGIFFWEMQILSKLEHFNEDTFSRKYPLRNENKKYIKYINSIQAVLIQQFRGLIAFFG